MVKRDGVIFEELTGWFEKSSFMVREDGWVFEKKPSLAKEGRGDSKKTL